eukprot:TRINITY_DN3072_c0_g1_i1.p1 TRINITY_DN3072_c0_g1~~TRINITY_DN3072_c0_g1_i1.p1  ORF type:complete len:287 (+),score=33.40 TRINITY_DN3072_c0_g1_i1:151-1011(+)
MFATATRISGTSHRSGFSIQSHNHSIPSSFPTHRNTIGGGVPTRMMNIVVGYNHPTFLQRSTVASNRSVSMFERTSKRWMSSESSINTTQNTEKSSSTKSTQGNAAVPPATSPTGNAGSVDKSYFNRVPLPPKILGALGLIPFWVGALGVWTLPKFVPVLLLGIPVTAYSALLAQMTYAYCITTFMGAVHFGLAAARYSRTESPPTNVQQWVQYTLSTVPSLLAWASFGLEPLLGVGAMIFLLTAVYAGDLWADRHGLVPSWYMSLRFPLTLGAVGALATSFFQLF